MVIGWLIAAGLLGGAASLLSGSSGPEPNYSEIQKYLNDPDFQKAIQDLMKPPKKVVNFDLSDGLPPTFWDTRVTTIVTREYDDKIIQARKTRYL